MLNVSFRWPVPALYAQADDIPKGYRFGEPRYTTATPHDHGGVDLGVYGTPVYAAAAGIVYFAGYVPGVTGWCIYINHPGGYQTRYMHLGSTLWVRAQDTVEAGQQIATVGELTKSGKVGAHLHFEILSGCTTPGCKEGSRHDPLVALKNSPAGDSKGGSLFATLALATAGAILLSKIR